LAGDHRFLDGEGHLFVNGYPSLKDQAKPNHNCTVSRATASVNGKVAFTFERLSSANGASAVALFLRQAAPTDRQRTADVEGPPHLDIQTELQESRTLLEIMGIPLEVTKNTEPGGESGGCQIESI
jgi:hypothetical protein